MGVRLLFEYFGGLGWFVLLLRLAGYTPVGACSSRVPAYNLPAAREPTPRPWTQLTGHTPRRRNPRRPTSIRWVVVVLVIVLAVLDLGLWRRCASPATAGIPTTTTAGAERVEKIGMDGTKRYPWAKQQNKRYALSGWGTSRTARGNRT